MRELGRGGMGAVYVVFDRELCREVALKRILPATAVSPDHEARFLRESRAVAAICHPGVPQIHHTGRTTDGAPWFTMEIVRGEPLRKILERERLEPRRALDLAIELGRILVAAHEVGVIHRDVKPSNIMLAPGDRVRLLDFGVCLPLPRFLRAAEARRRTAHMDRWETGDAIVAGTLGYSDPATQDGEEATTRSDLFSLAAILYEMLTGRRLFDQEGFCYRSIDSAEFPLELAPLAVDLRRAAARNPFERHRTVAEFVQRLEIARGHLLRAEASEESRDLALRARADALASRSFILLAVLVTVVVVVAGLLVARSFAGSSESRRHPVHPQPSAVPVTAAGPVTPTAEPSSSAVDAPEESQTPAVTAPVASEPGEPPPAEARPPDPGAAIRQVLLRRAPQLRRCVGLYDPALRRLPLRIELDARQAPRAVSLPGRPQSPLTLCVAAAVSDLRFPPATMSPIVHTLPLRTRP